MIGDFNLLFWLHLLALTAAGSAVFGVVIVESCLDAEADPNARKALDRLEMVGGIGFGALILSGLTMLWAQGYALQAMSAWFWVKMALLVVVFAGAFAQSRLTASARAGNVAAARRKRQLDWLMHGLFVAVTAAAVMAFN